MTPAQKESRRQAARRWREKHPDKARANSRASHEKNKAVYKARYAPRQKRYYETYVATLTPEQKKDRTLRKKYGITLADYTWMWNEQLGLCVICDVSLETRPAHVDHDHLTGVVRAILCQHCNQALGMIFESPALAIRLADYLRKHGK